MFLPIRATAGISGTQIQQITNPTLQSLAICFQEDFKQNSSLVKNHPSSSHCRDIIYGLMNRGALTEIEVKIEVDSASAIIKIAQIADSVVISLKGEPADVTLANTSLNEVHKNLINNLIISDKRCTFCPETVNNFLNPLIASLEEDPEKFNQDAPFYRGITLYILNDHREIILTSLKIATVRHCIARSESYADNELVLAIKLVIRLSTNHTNYIDSTRRILESPSEEYIRESIDSATLYDCAALYAIFNVCSYGPKITLVAVKHFFDHSENYSWTLISKATEVAIRVSTNCQVQDIPATARRVFESPETESGPLLLMSATIYLFQRDSVYTRANFNAIAKRIANAIKVHGYSPKLAEPAALKFINQHLRLFTDPVKNQKSQSEFVEFFRRNNKMDSLNEYSNNLMNALTADDSDSEGVNLFKVRGHLLSILGLWNAGLFPDAIRLNKKIPISILSDMEHAAVRHWNSRPNPPPQPDPTDRRYKRKIKTD